MWETWVWSLGWDDPLEKGKATHSNILVWRVPWGSKESDTTEQLLLLLFTFNENETEWENDAHISDDPYVGQIEGYEPKATLILVQGGYFVGCWIPKSACGEWVSRKLVAEGREAPRRIGCVIHLMGGELVVK